MVCIYNIRREVHAKSDNRSDNAEKVTRNGAKTQLITLMKQKKQRNFLMKKIVFAIEAKIKDV